MMLIVALLGGGAVLLAMQLTSTRSTGITKATVTSRYCAEAGVSAAQPLVAANYAIWNASLCNPLPPRGTGACVIGSPAAEPIWLRSPAVSHDLDGDGTDDFVLTLVDNDDEPAANDLTVDSDKQITIVSTCIMQAESPTQVSELVRYDAVTHKLTRKLWLSD